MRVIEADEMGAKPPLGFDGEAAGAWRLGYSAFVPRDPTVFNPYDGDTEAELYDAWEAGFDAASG